jgi:GxxExxY protein
MDLGQNENSVQSSELFEVAEKIIGCAYTVTNSLGCGFLEKVYENALAYELQQKGLRVFQQKPIKIHYKDVLVGEYVADLLVDDRILIELKAVQDLDDVHYAQCLNYLRATGLKTCLLLNFAKPELQVRRISARKEWAKR